jgi:hypothetical protein
MASLSSLVSYFWARPGAYHTVEYLKDASLGKSPGSPLNLFTRLERLARNKQSSLLQKFINDGRKKFYNIGP